ncbi:MAG: phosphate ABC transporter permease subunit PstC [Alcanivoracaceae bacterium]|nr:phosphate ABC transporter permease subunit PstC [Alcanivoracaceae bacterium]
MQTGNLLLLMIALAGVAWFAGFRRSHAVSAPLGGIRFLHSLPTYYASLAMFWCVLPSMLLLGLWLIFDGAVVRHLVVEQLPVAIQPGSPVEYNLLLTKINNVASGALDSSNVDPAIVAASERLNTLNAQSQNLLTAVVIGVGVLGGMWGWTRVQPQLRARQRVERVVRWMLMLSASIAILTTVGIVMSVLFESIRFFQSVSITEFLFGLEWSPQTALRADQVAASGAFGAVPLFAGTLLISAIALTVAVPVGLMSAIYLAEYAHPRVRAFAKPTLEILAGVPTVVYGFFAALTVAPLIRGFGQSLGLDVASESALAAGLVMGVMIIPFVSSLADDVITAVPQAMRDGSLALGATQSETIKKVVIPAALPGIMGGVLLAASRAIGETMIVVMAAGLNANLTVNPLEAVTTVTVQIVTLLVGDQEFDSSKTLAAFALGLMLFLTTLALNVLAMHIVKKYREEYE